MLRITAQVDYAVRAMVELSRHGGGPMKNADLAAHQRIPTRFLGITMAALAHQGLVESRRGGDGGYRLARPDTEISVCDVIEALGTGILDDRSVPVDGATTVTALWQQLGDHTRRLLAGVTIAQLAARVPVPPERPRSRSDTHRAP